MQNARRLGGPTPQEIFNQLFDSFERWRIVEDKPGGTIIAAIAYQDGAWFAWDNDGRLGPFVHIESALACVKHLHTYTLRWGQPNTFGNGYNPVF